MYRLVLLYYLRQGKGRQRKLIVASIQSCNRHAVQHMHVHVHTGMPLTGLHGGRSATELETTKAI